jgi:tetratricopeptide (TPR) repeat protein
MPAYRNWAERERAARSVLADHPSTPLAEFSLAVAQAQSGRWNEAAATASAISRSRFLLPGVEQFTVLALWAAGDIVKAELAGERAARRFPAYPGLWEARFTVLMHSGRTADALRMLDDPIGRPPGYPAANVEAARLTALALAGSSRSSEALKENLRQLELGDLNALTVVQRCVALNDSDEAFDILDGYYFGRGQYAAVQPMAEEDISTSELFMPPMKAAWGDARFADLTKATGLHAYWKESGCAPDFKQDPIC